MPPLPPTGGGPKAHQVPWLVAVSRYATVYTCMIAMLHALHALILCTKLINMAIN